MFAFEKLEIWQRSRSFASEIYRIVGYFPQSEQFALSQQLTRAAVSVTANIAEGSSRSSQKEFSRYIEVAYGSLCEVIAELFIALDKNYLTSEAFDQLYSKSEELGKMLSKFRGTLETSWMKSR